MMLSELCKYAGRNVFLYCSAGKKSIVRELLNIAESSAPLEIGSLRKTCLRWGGEGGREGGRGGGREGERYMYNEKHFKSA